MGSGRKRLLYALACGHCVFAFGDGTGNAKDVFGLEPFSDRPGLFAFPDRDIPGPKRYPLVGS